MPYLAVVGFVIALVALEIAQPPYGSPVAHAGQTIQAEAGGEAQQDQEPVKPPPTWPPTIGDAEKASRAECGEPKECRAEQREYSDLHAQWKAAEAAEGQEFLARWQTWITASGAVLAFVGTIALIYTLNFTRRAADAASDAARAAFEANQINREVMLAEQRPWLSVSYEIGGALEWTAEGCVIPLVFWLENSGKTPALQARLAAEVIAVAAGDLHPLQIVVADKVKGGIHNGQRITVFPGQKTRVNVLGIVTPKDLENAKSQMGRDWVFPGIVGCVVYSTNSGNTHETGFMFALARVPRDGSSVISPSEGNVPATELVLIPWIGSPRVD